MCLGCGNSSLQLQLSYTEEQKSQKLAQLPEFLKKKGSKIVKHILHFVHDKLADTIFRGGHIYTMNQTDDIVEAVAVKDGMIVAAGKEEDVMVFNNGIKTEVIDLKGKTMLPGFVEPHAHMVFGYFDSWLDVGPFVNSTFDEIKEKIQAEVKKAEINGEPVMCQLFDPLITTGQPFDYSMKGLDKFSQKVPIFLLEANGHIGHANSKAFEAVGVTNQTQDPPNARYIHEDGILTGQIQQGNALGNFLLKIKKPPTIEQYQQGVNKIFKQANSKGVTTFHDCGIGAIHKELDYSVLLKVTEDDPTIRVSGFLVSTHWQHWNQTGMKPEFHDTNLRIVGIKAWADGSTQGGSAFFREEYLKEEWGKGFANYSQEQLNKTVLDAHNDGWQVGIHCNGDAAIDMALNAYENARKNEKTPREDMRHRLEHTTFCHDEHFERMKQLDIYPSFLIGHIYYYGDFFKELIVGEKRADLCDRVKTAIKYDRRPTLHSDYNCQPIDPIRCIYNAVTRIVRNTCDILNKEERVTPLEAVRAVTIDAAWQCHMDDIVGSIEKGKMADFVILNKNPMQAPKADLINIKVQQTWFEGKLIYDRHNPQKTMKQTAK